MSKTCGPSYRHANMYMANHNEQPLEKKGHGGEPKKPIPNSYCSEFRGHVVEQKRALTKHAHHPRSWPRPCRDHAMKICHVNSISIPTRSGTHFIMRPFCAIMRPFCAIMRPFCVKTLSTFQRKIDFATCMESLSHPLRPCQHPVVSQKPRSTCHAFQESGILAKRCFPARTCHAFQLCATTALQAPSKIMQGVGGRNTAWTP